MSGHHASHGHHERGADFDWQSMAEALEVDGTMALPHVDAVVARLLARGLAPAGVAHVVDAGCGPGIVTCALARSFPSARVTGIDSAPPLLDRLRRHARDAGLDDRVEGIDADIEQELPPLPPADVVWASMVVHHVVDRRAVLQRLHDLLTPGGTLVLIEFGGHPEVLPSTDPLVAGGTWQRLEDGAAATLRERLGFDMVAHDWPSDLSAAGFADVDDRVVTSRHDPPLTAVPRRWLVRHVRRGVGMAGAAITAADVADLESFAAAVEDGIRTDAFVASERRVLTATRA